MNWLKQLPTSSFWGPSHEQKKGLEPGGLKFLEIIYNDNVLIGES